MAVVVRLPENAEKFAAMLRAVRQLVDWRSEQSSGYTLGELVMCIEKQPEQIEGALLSLPLEPGSLRVSPIQKAVNNFVLGNGNEVSLSGDSFILLSYVAAHQQTAGKGTLEQNISTQELIEDVQRSCQWSRKTMTRIKVQLVELGGMESEVIANFVRLYPEKIKEFSSKTPKNLAELAEVFPQYLVEVFPAHLDRLVKNFRQLTGQTVELTGVADRRLPTESAEAAQKAAAAFQRYRQSPQVAASPAQDR